MPAGAPRRVVVVGAGVAGQRCAFELRRCGFDGEIALVGSEPVAAYDRTLLSKEFIEFGLAAEDLVFHPAAEYEAEGIHLYSDVAVTGLDTERRRVRLADGRSLRFDTAVVATGGRPVRPPALNHPEAHVVRDLADAVRLRDVLRAGRRLIVVGAGFVGCEVAATATSLGARVSLVEGSSAPLSGVLGTEVAARLADLHRAHGVELVTGSPATGIRTRPDGAVSVDLTDGSTVSGDDVILAVGMTPDVGWLAGSGLRLRDGIVTDAWCRTSHPDVLAAGDCARWWNPRYGTRMRVEHWDTAARHGVAAARSALGVGEPFSPVPFFWSSQHGTRLQWVGHAPDWDSVEITDTNPPSSFMARYHKNNRLVAACGAGRPQEIAAARKELEEQHPLKEGNMV